MTLRSFFAGCIFNHGNRTRQRRGLSYVLVCDDCGHVHEVLQTETLRGPQFHQEPVLGEPKTTLFRDTAFGKRKVG